jgi:hypothetical protein
MRLEFSGPISQNRLVFSIHANGADISKRIKWEDYAGGYICRPARGPGPRRARGDVLPRVAPARLQRDGRRPGHDRDRGQGRPAVPTERQLLAARRVHQNRRPARAEVERPRARAGGGDGAGACGGSLGWEQDGKLRLVVRVREQ